MLIVLLMLVVLIHWLITGEYLGNDDDGSAERFKSVSTEVHHVCGVQTNGAVTCWGGSNNGQATPPGGAFTLVSAGVYHTCGIKRDQSVRCWGSDVGGPMLRVRPVRLSGNPAHLHNRLLKIAAT